MDNGYSSFPESEEHHRLQLILMRWNLCTMGEDWRFVKSIRQFKWRDEIVWWNCVSLTKNIQLVSSHHTWVWAGNFVKRSNSMEQLLQEKQVCTHHYYLYRYSHFW